jgi:transposase
VTTCWRRFAEWASAGVFERLQELLLDELGEAGRLDWSRVSVDSFSLRATGGGQVGANPVDRAKAGSKLHLAVDGGGLPLSLLVTGANTNDSMVFEALLDDIPAVRTPSRPAALSPREGPRRQGLQSSPLPRLPVGAGHQGPHRPLWDRVVDPAGPPPLESRAHDRLAGRLPTAAHPP